MKGKRAIPFIGSICMIIVLAVLHVPAYAAEARSTAGTPTPSTAWQPPKFISFGLTSTKSPMFAAAVALSSVIEEKTGIKFQVTPATKPAGRINLIKTGKAHIGFITANDAMMASEGIRDLEHLKPQSLRSVWEGGGSQQGIGTRASSGIRTWADVRGRKVAAYPTHWASQVHMDGALAYANLTWDDVIRTPVAGWAPGQTALLQGSVDLAFLSCQSVTTHEIQASIHGLYWMPLPYKTPEDKAAWARLNKVDVIVYPSSSTTIPGASADKPAYVWAWNYQVVCYDDQDENLVYWFVKQMHMNYDDYKNKHATLKAWTVEHNLSYEAWRIPRHKGYVRYFQDVGMWTPEMEAKQQELLAKYPQTMTRTK